MKFAFLAAAAACVWSAVAFAADKPMTSGAKCGAWTMDAPAALALAKQVDKPIFLCFTGSDWCGWCKLMEKKVFSTQTWQDYAAENLVTVWIDFPRDKTLVPKPLQEQNQQLAAQYRVQGFPTYVVLAPDGKTTLGTLGADQNATAETFIDKLKAVLILDQIETLLSAEDYAAYKALDAEQAALDKKAEAWNKRMQEEGKAFDVAFKAIEKKRDALKAKAVEAARKR